MRANAQLNNLGQGREGIERDRQRREREGKGGTPQKTNNV